MTISGGRASEIYRKIIGKVDKSLETLTAEESEYWDKLEASMCETERTFKEQGQSLFWETPFDNIEMN